MIISKKKPMVYGEKIDDGVLYYEVFDDGYGIMVKNIRGSHPCGYVRLPDEIAVKVMEADSKYCEESIWIDADIHGGITYSGLMGDFAGYFIGWDYAHYGDFTYTGYDYLLGNQDDKRWTTDEIIEEAKLVVKALREGKYEI